MVAGDILATVREALTVMAERYARLVEAVADTGLPIPGSEWSVREAAVHTAGGGHLHAAMATGDASPVPERLDKEYLDARMRSLIADNPETDPKKLADQIRDGYGAFLEATAALRGDQPTAHRRGVKPDVAGLASLVLGEPVLHGYDVAAAVGAPWPIDPGHAALVLDSYRAFYLAPQLSPPKALRPEATYRLEVAGVAPFSVGVTGGAVAEVPPAAGADCVISADPVSALLVISGRLCRWPAIALGGLRFTGGRADLGPRFFDLFVFP
jgi:uncharacterized protein (TIGR03083 family)